MSECATHELVKSISIENMANQRNAVVEKVSAALELLKEAETIAAAACVGFPRLVIDQSYSIRGSSVAVTGQFANKGDTATAISRIIDADGWRHLLDESGLRSLMDATARDQWAKAISDGNFPELTGENIRATFGALYDARGDMFERGVLSCFKRLSWDYKTNQPFKFGKRIIIGALVASYGYVNYRAADELDDLMRVFHVLDGKPEPDHRSGISSTINKAHANKERAAENDYLTMRWFKKGSAHITFKRLDLVDRMNCIIAKHYPGALARPK